MDGFTKPRATDVGGQHAHPILIPGSAQRASKSNGRYRVDHTADSDPVAAGA